MQENLPIPPAAPHSAENTTPAQRKSLRYELQDDVPFTAVSHTHPKRLAKTLELATVCARIAEDNRAKDIVILDLRSATSLVDYFIIATAPSRRQANSIAIEVDQEMKKRGEKKLGFEGSEEGRWTLIDYGDFVVHVFNQETREYYDLEHIWGDAAKVDWKPASAQTPKSQTSQPETEPELHEEVDEDEEIDPTEND